MGIRHKEMLLFFMEETDADPNIADTYQRTPLHEAVAMPDQDSVHLLVARGKANPNQQDLVSLLNKFMAHGILFF